MTSSGTSAKKPLPSLDSLKVVHIIGVCGTLMGAFAAFLKRRGIHVTGSDQNVYPPMSDVLKNAGVVLCNGFDPKNLEASGQRPDLVVIGNVISGSNAEAQAAIQGGYAYSSLPEAMENLMLKNTRNIVVSGTHGKTTTSSMMAHVLVQCAQDPSYFFGGVAHDLPYSFNVSSIEAGKYFVLEGDEYDTAFWDKVPKFNHYLPDDAILTSVEYDHADIYPNFEALEKAFHGLLDRIRPGGRLIACLDFPHVKKMLPRAQVPVITYGGPNATDARFKPGKIQVSGEWTHFEVLDNGKTVDEVKIALPGIHNITNALAVWIECRELGLPAAKVRQALASFRGVKRRQEVRGVVRDVTVIDDFAHHPTAVRETLRALRAKYPGKRLVAVFEPRSATSRRKVFQNDYVEAFCEADATFIAAPYDQSKIPAADQFSSEQLVADISARGKNAVLFTEVDCGASDVGKFARAQDVIAVMSNGGFGGFIPKLLDALKG
jgi:UDP-N-acetylmuramate: L-alanyl-gamma-D-glutamyl-meso-diaminopimelate ligase